ncbi:uncharacterized protein JN550_000934 [Neoarthrinium moseri]|uniref:uncharacterized protein n=1 Tax=Neoarthrinium moseri TaxID=1658444 RepID=UPI001FDD4ADD|nr:uncharacterized protein JN550_000934 [Neoarthrinium moseri]KAI1876862.1 hypothetical protein JN550_000934 [Neoarthrinium moseri]
MQLQFTTLDVFTRKRLEGNPLAVVQVPRSLQNHLSQAQKQKITLEFNLSETVFMHQPADEAPQEVVIDIFTLEQELPFAGHPTIGSAVLAKSRLYPSIDRFITKAGPIGLHAGSGDFIRAKIPHNVHIHAKTLGQVIPAEQHNSYVGLSHFNSTIREAELQAPVVNIVKGMTFILVKLPSLEHLRQVQLLRLDLKGLPTPLLDPEWSPSFTSRYYYVENGEVNDKGDQVRSIRTRMVELGFEDPATGSAASTLAAYLTIAEKTKDAKFLIIQGVEMGRRSDIHVQTTADLDESGKVKINDVWLGGEAVVVQQGTIEIDDE